METVRGINAYDLARGQSESVIKSRAYHAEYRKDHTYVPLLMGEDLARYENRWSGNHWISYGEWLAAPREQRFFLSDKIMVRKLLSSGRIVSFMDTEQYYTDQQLYIGILRESRQESLSFLCAILNSVAISCYYVSSYREKDQLFPQLTVNAFTKFPIRRISFTTPAEERARLGAELQDLYAQGKHAEILAAVQDWLPRDKAGGFIAGRERSDVVHDLLAFLAERMLEMNKAKQQEIRGFLGWLEGYLGAKVEDLTPKTKLQGYYEHDYESLLAVLKKNRKKLAVDPARREPGETLRAEFEGSMKKLGPLRERIRQTDELIDAVVYRLYALTEEEIGIVEGRNKSIG